MAAYIRAGAGLAVIAPAGAGYGGYETVVYDETEGTYTLKVLGDGDTYTCRTMTRDLNADTADVDTGIDHLNTIKNLVYMPYPMQGLNITDTDSQYDISYTRGDLDSDTEFNLPGDTHTDITGQT